ncbi:hypothetical protein IAI10_20320 [Clostridium sp. 19966]|uniref:hypothetical protein n=1 Tax=Clostridium sp. 19966 TaxID=2768166 RepID=UPI0028DF0905|nr:hypothetical protein [Clostridium sp. 19966]MDT8719003.1 hypothetical protein [Clostridium sp. 19966]
MINNINTNILQLEAKDIYNGVEIKNDNYKRYKASLDYSLEAIKINEISPRKNEFFMVDNKQYTNAVISVTFKYSVKDVDNKTITKSTKQLREELYENGFDITIASKKIHYVRFKRSSGSSRVGKCLFIREDLYKKMMDWSYMDICHDEGVEIDLAAIEAYIALTTSSIIDTITGIKKENILIIDEYISKFEDTVMATTVVNNNGTDRLHTQKSKIKIENNIWDGQALMDRSVFGDKYVNKGMLLLRNRFFKGACFNTNIQQFFTSAGITDVSQLNGFTFAKNIEDIKLICTKSCIKYSKFGKIQNWLMQIEDTWGVVKYDKPTHHLMGKYVQTHYQLLNTVRFNRNETLEFLQPSMDYLYKLLNDPRVMRNHLKMKVSDNEDIDDASINSTNDFMLTMMNLNDKFTKTQMYLDFRGDVRDSFIKNIRKGHILIEGNYSVLFGNGLEMLKATVKDKNNPFYFNGNSVLSKGEIHCKNFNYGVELLGCRSPHVTMGNLFVGKNVECKAIDKYFNLSNQIVCVNSLQENTLERLSSADFDSDQMLMTDNKQLIDKIKMNYDKFLVPTSQVEAKKPNRYNTSMDKTDLDINTSVNKIGEIINLSQILNTQFWDKFNKSNEFDEELYANICQLDVMSCIEIDKAKKEFTVDNAKELDILRLKYKVVTVCNANNRIASKKKTELYMEMLALQEDKQDYKYFVKANGLEGYYTKTTKPNFMKYTGNSKKKNLLEEANKKVAFKKYNSTMCYLEDIIDVEFKNINAKRIQEKDKITFSEMFQNEVKILTSLCDKDRVNNIIKIVEEYKNEVKAIWTKKITDGATEEEIKKINSQKYLDAVDKKAECISKISKLKVKSEDIKSIIKKYDIECKDIIKARNEKKKEKGLEVQEDKKYEIFGIGRFLLTVLFAAHRSEFLRIFEEQKENIEYLKYVNKDGDFKLYNMEYKIVKNPTDVFLKQVI